MAAQAIAAGVGAAASLAGSYMDAKNQKKALEQAAKQRTEDIGLIKQYGERAIQSITPAYQNAQATRQQGMNQNLGLAGSTFQPRMQAMQSGDYMAQQAILAGLMGQRNAILGDTINYGALQAQSVPVDYSALTGLTSPQGLDFTGIEAPDYSAMANTTARDEWTDGSASSYLAANPDVLSDYNAKREQLMAGGDPQFNTKEGYARWHYDNYGKAEGRPLSPTAATATSGDAPQEVFTSEQVSKALNADLGELNQFGEPR